MYIAFEVSIKMYPYPYLHQKIPQVFLESCDILIKTEEALNKNFDLRPVKHSDALIHKK